MTIELTDATRYQLEKDNCTNVILAANRLGLVLDVDDIARSLHVSSSDAQRVIDQLKIDGIIK